MPSLVMSLFSCDLIKKEILILHGAWMVEHQYLFETRPFNSFSRSGIYCHYVKSHMLFSKS